MERINSIDIAVELISQASDSKIMPDDIRGVLYSYEQHYNLRSFEGDPKARSNLARLYLAVAEYAEHNPRRGGRKEGREGVPNGRESALPLVMLAYTHFPHYPGDERELILSKYPELRPWVENMNKSIHDLVEIELESV